MKKNLFILLLGSLVTKASLAQDPNFSQFFASPLTLNPALTGKFDGTFRVAGNYRNQWPTILNAYTTKTISADFGILRDRISEIDQFGIGFLGFSDVAGDGVLVTNNVSASIAYHKGLDENGYHQLGAGFQGGYVNKRLDVTKVYFADELTPTGFVPGTTSEFFANRQINVSYFDLNAGVFYNGSTNGDNNFFLGASMYHINRPKESFQGGDFILNPRVTIQGGGRLPTGAYNNIHFSSNYSFQAGATNLVFGGAYALNVNGNLDNPTNVYLGAWARFNNVNDAIIPYIGLEFGSLHFGYTYDINVSSLKAASNSIGGNEISLIFIKKPTDPNAKKLNCPKF